MAENPWFSWAAVDCGRFTCNEMLIPELLDWCDGYKVWKTWLTVLLGSWIDGFWWIFLYFPNRRAVKIVRNRSIFLSCLDHRKAKIWGMAIYGILWFCPCFDLERSAFFRTVSHRMTRRWMEKTSKRWWQLPKWKNTVFLLVLLVIIWFFPAAIIQVTPKWIAFSLSGHCGFIVVFFSFLF